jgi:hypothetical protein
MYRKASVMLSHLVPSRLQSKRLFGDRDYERSDRLLKAIDEINARNGRDAVRFWIARPSSRWQTKFLLRAARYTTCLKEVFRKHLVTGDPQKEKVVERPLP